MGRILHDSIHDCYYGSSLGRTRPNRRADISPFRWVLQMKIKDTQQLGISVYIHALRKQIEEEVKSRYTKRIDYLVNANNELMKELEHWENEIITVSKESAVDIEEGGDELLHEEGGSVHDGDGFSEEKQEYETATAG